MSDDPTKALLQIISKQGDQIDSLIQLNAGLAERISELETRMDAMDAVRSILRDALNSILSPEE